jgi:hypothetical protein
VVSKITEDYSPYQAKEFHESHPYVPEAELEKRLKAKAEAEAAEAKTSSVSDIFLSFDCRWHQTKTVQAVVTEYIHFTKEKMTDLTSTFGMLLQRINNSAAATFPLSSALGVCVFFFLPHRK